MSYININTNQYPVSEQDIRNQYPNTSFAVPFEAPEEFAVVFLAPAPAVENPIIQTAREIAPVLTEKGNYEQAYEIVDIYSDYTDADGKVVTKAEQEAVATAKDEQTKKDVNVVEAKRLLVETDFAALVDVRATLENIAEFDSYRATLRDIVINPPVTITDWPVKPKSVWL